MDYRSIDSVKAYYELPKMPINFGVCIRYNEKIDTCSAKSIFEESFQNYLWNIIVYPDEYHLREILKYKIPDILMVSLFWGFNSYMGTARTIDDLLYNLISVRKKTGMLNSPFIILMDEHFPLKIRNKYMEKVHYDLIISDPYCLGPHKLDLNLLDKITKNFFELILKYREDQ